MEFTQRGVISFFSAIDSFLDNRIVRVLTESSIVSPGEKNSVFLSLSVDQIFPEKRLLC